MSYSDLFNFIQEREPVEPVLENPIDNTQAETICSYSQFMTHLSKVITNVIPNCQFVSDDDLYKYLFPDKSLETHLISFKVKRRSPFKEIKPTMRHEVLEDVPEQIEKRIGTAYAQRMEYILQFNLFSSGYASAEKVMSTFEEAVFSYTSFLKKKGVVELVFKEQLEDETYHHFRTTCSMRHLQYLLILEKQWVDFDSVLESVVIS